MSILTLTRIISRMGVRLTRPEIEELYYELLTYFGLIGARDECQALESAWNDPYNRRLIEEFIEAWLKKRKKREAVFKYAGSYHR